MRKLVLVVLVGVLATAAVAAPAQVTERVRVASAGGQLTKGFPAGVFVWIVSPPAYARASLAGDGGRWVGPRYAATGDGTVGGDTSISWSLRFAQAKDAVAAANSSLAKGWPVDLRGGISVPHVIGGRTVGTILGHYVLTAPPGDRPAAYELAVAFAVGPGVFALLRYELPDPVSDDAGAAGSYVVNGLPASVWNRGQALWAMTSLELHGTLPPTRVSARVAPDGRVVRGTVGDAFRHPVVRARVALQRLTGSAWRTVASTRTDKHGVYALRGIATRGRYRTVATLGSAAVRSSSVVAGPMTSRTKA